VVFRYFIKFVVPLVVFGSFLFSFFYFYPWTPEQSARYLSRKGYALTYRDFFRAIVSGEEKVVRAYLTANFSPNYVDEYSNTPLHLAVKWQKVKVLKVLLSHGAEPNFRDIHLRSPLFYAVQLKSEEMVRLLLKYGADPNLRDEEGFTPRVVARKLGLVNIEKILASYGGEF